VSAVFQAPPLDLARMLQTVSDRVGIIRSLTLLQHGADEPALPVLYHAVLSNHDFVTGKPADRATMGKGRTDADAMRGAIGEALERYCGHHSPGAAIRVCTAGELDGAIIDPREIVLYSESQYARGTIPFARYDEATTLGWLRGAELPDRTPVWLPAALVYLNYLRGGADLLAAATSSGMAAGQSVEAAVLGGLCELIERDAFLIGWMARLPSPGVEVRGVDPLIDDLVDDYARFGIEVRVIDLSLDQPAYVMLAISIDRSGAGPAALIGIGCHLDPVRAVEKALFEIAQMRAGSKRSQERQKTRLATYADVHTLHDHGNFVAPLERLAEFDFLLDRAPSRKLSQLANRSSGDVAGDLAIVVDGLCAAGSRVAYADVTTDDVAAVGVRVVRTIATHLQPMAFGYGFERLGGRRLFELPAKLGLRDAVLTESELNPCPHPMP
jgi:ribosomal protein S12 methylthiotransferase accessory factor